MIGSCEAVLSGDPKRRLAGLIAPHLDFDRGSRCYADAYGVLAVAEPPRRFVILGTNHFGRSSSVVATRKDFQTPLGTTPTDLAFIEALETQLGADLCEQEFDHQNEHSVELQVLILQHMLGADGFEIVPVLCQDPCGPTGTAPYDGNGVDLREFGEALGDLIRGDDASTMVIAGADLSHVGPRFGDDRELDARFLAEVERVDRTTLDALVADGRDGFVAALKAHDNRTRVCSAGCVYALTTALPDARPELLRYHQAVDRPSGTCVTCSAVAFWSD
jgi:AmmeMemoRadiSam system protein B